LDDNASAAPVQQRTIRSRARSSVLRVMPGRALCLRGL
jgi:hypothetical protein